MFQFYLETKKLSTLIGIQSDKHPLRKFSEIAELEEEISDSEGSDRIKNSPRLRKTELLENNIGAHVKKISEVYSQDAIDSNFRLNFVHLPEKPASHEKEDQTFKSQITQPKKHSSGLEQLSTIANDVLQDMNRKNANEQKFNRKYFQKKFLNDKVFDERNHFEKVSQQLNQANENALAKKTDGSIHKKIFQSDKFKRFLHLEKKTSLKIPFISLFSDKKNQKSSSMFVSDFVLRKRLLAKKESFEKLPRFTLNKYSILNSFKNMRKEFGGSDKSIDFRKNGRSHDQKIPSELKTHSNNFPTNLQQNK